MPEQDAEQRIAATSKKSTSGSLRSCDRRSEALPAVQERALRRRLPGGRAHPRVPRGVAQGDFAEGGRDPARRQRPAGRHRARLPAGSPVRGSVRPRQEGRAGRRRLAGALRRRLGGREHCLPKEPPTPTGRPGGRRRLRSRRADRRRRAGPHGPRGARLRGAARHRRRAPLRHPRVPPAQGHRRPRGREPAPAWASRSSATSSSGGR